MQTSKLLMLIVALTFASASRSMGQITNAGTGSTLQGDVLRGEGVFLQGLGSWELNDAKVSAINTDTAIKARNWDIQYYDWLQRKYNATVDRKRKDYQKFVEAEKQRQSKLRTEPTQQDVENGNALNALLTDLSNPKIDPYAWKSAKIPLPLSVSIRTLAFQFAEKNGQGSQVLKSNVIALGRLDLAGHWPGYLKEGNVSKQRQAYEAAYAKLVSACEKNEPIVNLAIGLDKEIAKLRSDAVPLVPKEKGYQVAAGQFITGIEGASKAFHAETMDFASDFIADSHRHQAETVGDLLAFMRKYRLYFAPADKNPDTIVTYDTLYQLLKQQAARLDLKPDLVKEEAVRDGEVRIGFPARIVRGAWSIENEDLVQAPTTSWFSMIFGDSSWSHYNLEYNFRLSNDRGDIWTFVNQTDKDNQKNFFVGGWGNARVGVGSISNGVEKKGEKPINFDRRSWHSVLIQVRGSSVHWFIDSELVMEHQDARLSGGKVGLGGLGTGLRIRNIRINTPDGKTLLKGLPLLNP